MPITGSAGAWLCGLGFAEPLMQLCSDIESAISAGTIMLVWMVWLFAFICRVVF